MMYANPAVASGMMSSAIMNPGMVGGDVWRGYKSIDQTQPAFSEPTPTSAMWDGGEAMSPLARSVPSAMGFMARFAAVASLLGVMFGFQSGCSFSFSGGSGSMKVRNSSLKHLGVECTEAAARQYAIKQCRNSKPSHFKFNADTCRIDFSCSYRW